MTAAWWAAITAWVVSSSGVGSPAGGKPMSPRLAWPAMTAIMFGSLMVQTWSTPVAMTGAQAATYRANSSTAPSAVQPPRASNHCGTVKWCRVTMGRSPRAIAPSTIRR